MRPHEAAVGHPDVVFLVRFPSASLRERPRPLAERSRSQPTKANANAQANPQRPAAAPQKTHGVTVPRVFLMRRRVE